MFKEKEIRNIIRKYVDIGIKKFVIYPFGTNGVTIKNCMQECFGISPVLIVDNTYAQYNPLIIDINKLRQCYRKDMYILLTVEDYELNVTLKESLLEFIPENRIINDLFEKNNLLNLNKKKMQVGDRFSMLNILPAERKCDYNVIEGKIKVRIENVSYVMWNTVKTICEAFEKDIKYDVLVILNDSVSIETKDILIRQMEHGKHRYVLGSEYCAEKDKADILIVFALFGNKILKNVRENTKLIVVALMDLIRYSDSINTYWFDRNFKIEAYNPDYFLADSLLFSELQNTQNKVNVVEMGNAKFDGIYNACKQKQYPVGWEKLKGKRVVLWTTTHGIADGFVSNIITFDLYAQEIFKYLSEHLDIGLILRLHPTFINNELLKYGYWNNTDLNEIRAYCLNSPNVVWDDSDLYESAFSVADAIITDNGCGVMISALPTLKPICVMYRSDVYVSPYNKEIEDNYYSASCKEEIVNFFNMVSKKEDPMLFKRKELAQKWVKHFDGKNGERIKEFIISAFNLKMEGKTISEK